MTKYQTIDYASLNDNQLTALAESKDQLTYFNCVVCPFAHRTLWAALEVNADIDTVVEVDVFNIPSTYKQLVNRYGSVPFLVHNGFKIYDSTIIVNYIDSEFGKQQLARTSNSKQAALAAFASLKVSHLPFYRYLMGRDETDGPLRDHLTELETIYREDAAEFRADGPFLLGAAPSIADINIVPLLFRFEILLGHYLSYKLLEDFPLLAGVLAASKERQAFQDSSREPAYYIQGYASVAAHNPKLS